MKRSMTTRRTKSAICAMVASAALAAMAIDRPAGELPQRISDETDAQRDARLRWWQHDRFGMFIHFGLYSILARHEWVKSYEAIDDKDYDSHLPRFDPDLFDAGEWARAAKAAGMKYIVLTTKHHEGFCMWDSAVTDYKITKTPFGRDLVREFVDACRAAGLKVGFYYSVIDWNHPDFAVDGTHPKMKRLERSGLKGEELTAAVADMNKGRDMNRYRDYMFAQVKELLTNYGKIDIMWFDYTSRNWKSWRDWSAVELVRMTRRLQPGIIINNRLGLMGTDDGWDFVTPEQIKSATCPGVRGRKVPWETCQTFSGSWGYYRDQNTWKSVPQLIGLLAETVSHGGNLIMNVGPTGRGDFDGRAKDRLAGFAKWMHFNARSIYGCTSAPEGLETPKGTALTYNPKTRRLYIHIFDYPMDSLNVSFWDRIDYAQFLHDASEIAVVPPFERRWNEQSGFDLPGTGKLKLPMPKPDIEVPVVEIWLKDR